MPSTSSAPSERAQSGPKCLIPYGDSHQGNSFLRADGQRVWHDWQLVRKGRPWRDVTYFMLAALTTEERRASAAGLIRHYREALKATGAEGVLDQDAAWDELRRWPIYGLQVWMASMDPWGQGGLQTMIERFCSAIEDFDTISPPHQQTPRRQVTLGGEGSRRIA